MIGKPIFAKLDPFFFGNRKIMRAGRNGRDVFLFALCMNAQRGAPGFVPSADLEPWYIARQLNIPEEDAADGVTRAVTAGLLRIDGERVVIVGWGEDWGRYPLSRAEIQSNYRKRKGNAESEGASRYQDEVTSYDQSNALPIEKREKKRESAVTRNSLSVLPEDFSPSQKARKVVEERRLDLAHELSQFRDYNASRGSVSRDWDANFCKWLRNSKDVDRKPSRGLAPKMKSAAHVARHRNVDGSVRFVLSETDGNQREISAEEAEKYAHTT